MFQLFRRRQCDLLFDSSEEESQHSTTLALATERSQRAQVPAIRGGSVLGRAYIDRNRKEGNDNLVRDYFAPSPTYGEKFFRRRFRMSRPLFLRIHDNIISYSFSLSLPLPHSPSWTTFFDFDSKLLCFLYSPHIIDLPF